MNGTTLCPHCDTRFKIVEAQLDAHHGMVRCGHCLQAFDAHPNFIPDQPNPQLELPILDEPATHSGESPPSDAQPALDISEPIYSSTATHHSDESPPESDSAALDALFDHASLTTTIHDIAPAEASAATTGPGIEQTGHESPETVVPIQPVKLAESAHPDLLDFSQPENPSSHEAQPEITLPPAQTLAERVVIVADEHDSAPQYAPRKWPWTLAAVLCLLVLTGQASYFFRVDLAARLPSLKPALVAYCQLLRCSVPLPQKGELMSIESSDLEADPALESQITLNALLRNRAIFSQAFPHLELTLNDTQDKPLARRIFKPADYLPPLESENFGLLPNHELGIKLHLDVADLKPTGYRLVLFYPQN